MPAAKRLLAVLLFCGAADASALELVTPRFSVMITVHCEEGSVSCDNVTYRGVNRKTGAAVVLKGRTHHTLCADGVTPCRFLGYVFKKGNIRYFVGEDGTLTVTRGEREVLVSEQGEWKY
jgi:hypothetical protein